MILCRGTFPVHSYEVDADGILAPPAIAGYLLEIAGRHAAELRVGIEQLMPRGLTWVLSRLRLAVDRPVVLGEELTIETWPSGVERLFALRDFRVKDAQGKVVARAASQWLVLSLETRRAVWPDEAIDERVRAASERVFEEPFIKLPPLTEPEEVRTFDTRYQDIDRNLHVTSTSYVAWGMEAIPLDTWRSSRLSFLEIHYHAECYHPTRVLSRSRALGDGKFQHAITRESDGADLARLTTTWRPR